MFNLLRKSTDKVLSLYSVHSPIPLISSPDAINMAYFNIYIILFKKYYWCFLLTYINGICMIVRIEYKFIEIALFTEH